MTQNILKMYHFVTHFVSTFLKVLSVGKIAPFLYCTGIQQVQDERSDLYMENENGNFSTLFVKININGTVLNQCYRSPGSTGEQISSIKDVKMCTFQYHGRSGHSLQK